MSSRKYIVGTGTLLGWAQACWAQVEPDTVLHAIDVGQDRDYQFDLETLAGIDPNDATAFVVWNAQFLNFRRLELMGELKARGFRMPPLVCRGALVAPDVRLGENCAVAGGAVIETGSRLGIAAFVGAGAIVGSSCRIGNAAWIAEGSILGAGVEVSANATVGRGVLVDDNVKIGRQSILDHPGRRRTDLAPKTFLMAAFVSEVTILETDEALLRPSPDIELPVRGT